MTISSTIGRVNNTLNNTPMEMITTIQISRDRKTSKMEKQTAKLKGPVIPTTANSAAMPSDCLINDIIACS